MLELKEFVTPNTINLATLFERVLMNKLPEYRHIYDDMKCTASEERLAFSYLINILTMYKPDAIVFMQNQFFKEQRDSVSYLNHKYVIDEDKNNTIQQKNTISMLEAAFFVAAYFQKVYDTHGNDAHTKNLFFRNVSKEDLDFSGYTDLESDRRNIHHHFWRIPFVISEEVIKD